MRLPRLIRWLMWMVAGMIGLVVSLIVFLAFVRIPVDLTGQKNMLEWAASRSLGRRVAIDGKIIVSTSLWPSFQSEGVRLGNPEDFNAGDFAVMKAAKVSVGVLPLLKWNVHIREFIVKGVSLSLKENEKGAINWSPHVTEKLPTGAPKEKKSEKDRVTLTSDAFVLEKLSIEDIAVSYERPGLEAPLEIRIDQCEGSALVGEPFTLSVQGRLFKESFSATLKSGSLQELLEENRSWSEININIAKTRFELAGELDLSQSIRQINLKASVQGDRLDSLNELLKLNLPPLTSYRARANLSGRKGRIDLSDLEVRVAQSKLTGKMFIEKTGSRSTVSIELTAPQIQLNDFVFKAWSFESGSKGETPKKRATTLKKDAAALDKIRSAAKSEDERIKNLFSRDFLAKFDAKITIKAENVLSGKDKLGSGLMTAALEEGRFSIEPMQLNIPGGSFSFGVSLKPGVESSDATVKMLMKNFDFGILARRARPDSNMGGTLNLDINLKSKAKDLKGLLTNASGYVDFSGTPENLQAGILDFWAVNLIAAITASAESKNKGQASKINCVACRWSVKDGILKPDVFVIDTSKIRICGEGKVDLNKERIDLVVAPFPKKPEFFSLATPLAVKGTFADFKMGIQSGGLIGTSIRFITSPFVVPFARLVDKGLPEDGSDVCSMRIGPDNRPEKPIPGCILLRAK
jgi:uncharacterized protein involved in outer membrane biogenesis